MTDKRIGIFGGTFNPPHLGHIQAAKHAVEALALDRLLLIPDRIAPHKVMPAHSPTPQQRLEMLQIAAAGHPKLEVCDLELHREGPSYTYETVEQLHALYPDAQLVLLMGSDMFLTFQNWKNPQRILAHAQLAVFCRGNKGEKAEIAEKQKELEQQGHTVTAVENRVLEISSTSAA